MTKCSRVKRVKMVRRMKRMDWWIERKNLLARSKLGNDKLSALRVRRFRVVISLLEEKKDSLRRRLRLAKCHGLTVYSVPVKEGGVPSRENIEQFLSYVRALPDRPKITYCDTGLGRSAFMGAAYWIDKGEIRCNAQKN